MKKKILGLFLIITMLVGILFMFTGCGNSESNNIVKELNNIVSEEVKEWKEKGYGATLSVYNIQYTLEKNNSQYVIVASGDEEFTMAPDFTEYKEKGISNYDGNTYSNMRMLEEEMAVKHFVVYAKEENEYYDVEVTYEEADLNGAKKEYPVFNNAKALK